VPLRCDEAGRYTADLDGLARALPGARALLICSPHNPVARVFAQDELEQIAQLCLQHDVLMVSDEIHADLVLGPQRHLPLGSLGDEIARRSITLMAPSKTFNIAGLALGFAVSSDPDLTRGLRAAASQTGCSITLPAWVATEAAYGEQGAIDWLDALRGYLGGNMAYLASALERCMPEVVLSPTEGTFLAWLDCRGLDLGEEPGAFFLREAKVALNEGTMFGPRRRGGTFASTSAVRASSCVRLWSGWPAPWAAPYRMSPPSIRRIRPMETLRIGIIGTENSHAVAAMERFNVKRSIAGATVAALCPGDGDTMEHAQEIAEKGLVQRVVAEPQDLLDQVDGVIIMNRHGALHTPCARLTLAPACPPLWTSPSPATWTRRKSW
jgi:hypothetical protein